MKEYEIAINRYHIIPQFTKLLKWVLCGSIFLNNLCITNPQNFNTLPLFSNTYLLTVFNNSYLTDRHFFISIQKCLQILS